jgi:hypothetical protein
MASLGSFDIRARALSELTAISGIDESKTGRHRIPLGDRVYYVTVVAKLPIL